MTVLQEQVDDTSFPALLQAQGIAPPPDLPATRPTPDTEEKDDEDHGARPHKRQRDETPARDDRSTEVQSDCADWSKTEEDKLNAFKVRNYNPRTLFLMFY